MKDAKVRVATPSEMIEETLIGASRNGHVETVRLF
jgi:hypothetical protein